jgi:hypothetical protein
MAGADPKDPTGDGNAGALPPNDPDDIAGETPKAPPNTGVVVPASEEPNVGCGAAPVSANGGWRVGIESA